MSEFFFTASEKSQIENHGLNDEIVAYQIEKFKKGFPFTKLAKSCSIEKEIKRIEEKDFESIINNHEKAQLEGRITKFVPASGAASRMFKSLLAFYNDYEKFENKNLEELATQNGDIKEVLKFFSGLHNFAFFEDLKNILAKENLDINTLINNKEIKTIIEYLIKDIGLNYANLPKSVLKFHKYTDNSRTSFEEHLVEGNLYAKDENNKVRLHFTVSQEHTELIKELFETIKTNYDSIFEIGFSIQKTSTDTVAVDMENNLFKDKNNNLVFRPAGHGALIENLEDLQGDIVFIKNIDNVVPDRLKDMTILYKKIISGYLLKIQEKIFAYLNKIDKNELDTVLLKEIELFLENELNISINSYDTNKTEAIHKLLNRPIRVCGMVKNEGEAGGGPFVVEDENKELSLQIVESSQIDLKNEEQKTILTHSTHFNPVDLVCALKDYKGNNFKLSNYIDPNTGFISIKSKDGKDLKAMELPGLWNGAMAHWNTIFIEVPIITFNPVKTINDLLRKEHLN